MNGFILCLKRCENIASHFLRIISLKNVKNMASHFHVNHLRECGSMASDFIKCGSMALHFMRIISSENI